MQELPLAPPPFHAIYLSVVQIDHSDPDQDAQVLIKVFTDDLQDVIRAAYPKEYQPADLAPFCISNQHWIESYFQSKLGCEINGRPTELVFASCNRENEVYWLKFTIKTPKRWQTIKVTASFFMEIFSTQSNVIQLLNEEKKRFARLTKNSEEVTFEF